MSMSTVMSMSIVMSMSTVMIMPIIMIRNTSRLTFLRRSSDCAPFTPSMLPASSPVLGKDKSFRTSSAGYPSWRLSLN